LDSVQALTGKNHQKSTGLCTKTFPNHVVIQALAETLGLPIQLVVYRKSRAKIFCSKKYYEFICCVESFYLANLTLEMMLAYADGDIIKFIKAKFINSTMGKSYFDKLCDSVAIELTEKQKALIMGYFMDRYATMRRCYFVKHLKGTSKKVPIIKELSLLQPKKR